MSGALGYPPAAVKAPDGLLRGPVSASEPVRVSAHLKALKGRSEASVGLCGRAVNCQLQILYILHKRKTLLEAGLLFINYLSWRPSALIIGPAVGIQVTKRVLGAGDSHISQVLLLNLHPLLLSVG